MAIRTKTFVSHWPRLPGDLYNSMAAVSVSFVCAVPSFPTLCLPVGRWGSLYWTRPLQSELPLPGEDHGGCLDNRGTGVLCYVCMEIWGGCVKTVNVEPSYCPTFPFFLPSILPSFSPFHPLLLIGHSPWVWLSLWEQALCWAVSVQRSRVYWSSSLRHREDGHQKVVKVPLSLSFSFSPFQLHCHPWHVLFPRVSKQIMSDSSVPVVPGYFGEDQSDSRLREEAEKLGSVYHSILQYTTVYYSILQYITVHHTIPQYITLYHSISHYTTVYHSILQYITVYYSILQYIIAYHSILPLCILQVSSVDQSWSWWWWQGAFSHSVVS